MSSQQRFSGSSVEEALRRARATLGDGVRLVSAERVTKPGLLGKRVHFTVVVEAPPRPVSAQGFAAALRSAMREAPTRAPQPDEEDYRAVQAELAEVYRAEAPATPVHKVFGRDGRVMERERVERPSFPRTSTAVLDPEVGGNGSPLGRGEPVALSAGAASMDDLVIDIAGDVPVLRMEETTGFRFVPEHRLVAVVAPGVLFPLDAFRRVAEAAGVPEEQRFVLGRCRGELPSELVAPASMIARSLQEVPRTVVLVDPPQLALLRGSFLDQQMAVVAALETARPSRELAHELEGLGPVDAVYPIGDPRLVEGLGVPVLWERGRARRG